AIKHRRRTTQDLHALGDFRVDVVALGLGVRAVEETVRDLDAVDLSQDPVAVDATDVVAADPATLPGAAHRRPRFITHQIPDGIDIVTVQFVAGLHRDRSRHTSHALFLASGADGHLLKVQGAAPGAFFQHDAVVAQLA